MALVDGTTPLNAANVPHKSGADTISGVWTFTKALVAARTVLTYGASIAIDAALGNWFSVTVTDGAAHAFANPTNPATGQRMTLTVRNTFGTIATATFGTAFKTASYAAPANGNSTSADFAFDGTNWVQVTPWVTAIPN